MNAKKAKRLRQAHEQAAQATNALLPVPAACKILIRQIKFEARQRAGQEGLAETAGATRTNGGQS